MMALAEFSRGAILGLSCAAAPGPFQAVLVARSLRVGPVRALPLALVPVASDPVAIALVLAVLTQLPSRFLEVLTVVGALVVLWMAAGALRAALSARTGPAPHPTSRGFWASVLVNVTNPNVWIFWSAVGGPLLAAAWRRAPSAALAFLLSFYLCIAAGNAALALLAGGIARAGPRVERTLGLASGAALLGFGTWQLVRVFWPGA
ncbi:MAG TPA: LysE family transporter [Anaeromyxobacter sp.]|nr:LysE family transporter [Anaeromyxobacter sp.]